jgi:hypothetical protein
MINPMDLIIDRSPAEKAKRLENMRAELVHPTSTRFPPDIGGRRSFFIFFFLTFWRAS